MYRSLSTGKVSLLLLLRGRQLPYSLLIGFWLVLSSDFAVCQPLRFVTQDFPPYSYLEEGRVSGPAPALVLRVCRKMEIACEIDLLPWRRAQRNTHVGSYQGMFPIGWNRERSEWLHFSPPLLSTAYGLFVSAKSELTYRRPEDIRGLKIAVYGPSNTATSLEKLSREAGGVEVIMSPDDETGFRQLPAGRVDAVYSNREVGQAMLKRLGITSVRYAGNHRELTYYIGFPKQHVDAALVNAFSAAYRQLLQSGEIDALLRPYGMRAQPAED